METHLTCRAMGWDVPPAADPEVSLLVSVPDWPAGGGRWTEEEKRRKEERQNEEEGSSKISSYLKNSFPSLSALLLSFSLMSFLLGGGFAMENIWIFYVFGGDTRSRTLNGAKGFSVLCCRTLAMERHPFFIFVGEGLIIRHVWLARTFVTVSETAPGSDIILLTSFELSSSIKFGIFDQRICFWICSYLI